MPPVEAVVFPLEFQWNRWSKVPVETEQFPVELKKFFYNTCRAYKLTQSLLSCRDMSLYEAQSKDLWIQKGWGICRTAQTTRWICQALQTKPTNREATLGGDAGERNCKESRTSNAE